VNFLAPHGTGWEIVLWRSFDPCPDEETLWYTPPPLPAGPWDPPAYYHLIRIISGSVLWKGQALVNGFELSLPAGGGNLSVAGAAVVQLGFRI